MPPKIRELIAELEKAGLPIVVARGAIETLYIRRRQNRSQYLGRQAMTRSIIRFGPFAVQYGFTLAGETAPEPAPLPGRSHAA